MYCIECGSTLPTNRTPQTICSTCKTPLSTWWDESSQTYRTNRESILGGPYQRALSGPVGKRHLNLNESGPNAVINPNGGSGSARFTHARNGNGSGTGTGIGDLVPGLRNGGAGMTGSEIGGMEALAMEYGISIQEVEKMRSRRNQQTEEERNFNGALVTLELHFERPGSYLMKAMVEVKKMVGKTLDLSLNKAEVRETLAKNVDVWMHLQKIFNTAIPSLEKWSVKTIDSPTDLARSGHDVSESAELILKNYDALREDLHYLNNLLVISRNMLAIKDTAQELCATVQFDRAVHRLVALCVNVTSKGYDGETVDDAKRLRLNEITELYKKLLVTCLQHTHNWTMGNDRFKMSFWFEMLFDEDLKNDPIHDLPPDNLDVQMTYQEVGNWIRRHNRRDPLAAKLLEAYSADVASGYTPGPLPLPESEDVPGETEESTSPIWKPDLKDKPEQDRLYARVSHEIDLWWKKVRDRNFDGWVVQMESVESAKIRAASCIENAMHRYLPRHHDADHYEEQYEHQHENGIVHADEHDDRSLHGEDGEEDEDEEDDDDSYSDGPLRGLLTEIPNILDTKQIEALHMTVKACVVDSMGSGLTPAGENLQKTRCKMFLALDCGKNLLREMLVFIAVWEQTDQQFIFQITAQIIESFHHNALLPYAWNSLRILKDIVSPAQTVLLRLINYMFRARKDSPIYDDVKDYQRDAKLIHFLYGYFRTRVVPDCLALIYAQAQIRQNKKHVSDFPVDLWDMERAKDGLSQYLDFLSVIAELPEMRNLLIEWDTVYELIALLKALEAGVARKALDERAHPSSTTTPQTQHQPLPPQPPLHDTPHRFPWSGIKIQILIILTALIAPTNTRRNGPGNPTVQKQLLSHDGVMPLLNCCVYDGWNEYLKERATLAIKFLMEGCREAQDFVKELVPVKQAQVKAQMESREQAQIRAREQAGNTTGVGPAASQNQEQVQGGAVGSAGGSGGDNASGDMMPEPSGIAVAREMDSKLVELRNNMRSVQIGSKGNEGMASNSASDKPTKR
ncbi:hypothetical protein WAI453_010192 [Rhynchosporium graminicola]|uniref:Ataxin-10 homolog n=1 Tax=Rhynchosporium graminicola TaxID=2792576 RepID=A0A1E1KFJ7_9HELO|nr:uncharacterized protein RCO7_02631 [Rhynchosporium commune]